MAYKTALIVCSDRVARGEREDACMPVLRAQLGPPFEIVRATILADDAAALQAELIDLCDRQIADLVVTSGGTGLASRDRTPQATAAILDYEVPGIPEAMRAASLATTATAMLSRALAGVRGRTLIVNLPGSPKAVEQTLAAILPAIPHALDLLANRVLDG